LKRAAAAAAAAAAAGGRRPWEAPARRRPPTYAPLLLTPLASPPLNLWPVLVFHCTALAFASLAAAATDRSPWLNSEVCWPSCWYGQADPSGHGLRARAMAAASRPASPNKKNSQGWHQRADPVSSVVAAAGRPPPPRATGTTAASVKRRSVLMSPFLNLKILLVDYGGAVCLPAVAVLRRAAHCSPPSVCAARPRLVNVRASPQDPRPRNVSLLTAA
jgi:hypothetical protein